MKISRQSEFVVNITRQGCQPAVVKGTNKVAAGCCAALARNDLVRDIVGIGIDAATEASPDLVPNPVSVKLNC